jgi:hypothetical protein
VWVVTTRTLTVPTVTVVVAVMVVYDLLGGSVLSAVCTQVSGPMASAGAATPHAHGGTARHAGEGGGAG